MSPEDNVARKTNDTPRPSWWPRTKALIVSKILGVDDTPHRIAAGVFLGFVVAATPTIGLQMVIYVAIAALFRVNKVSGILPVWTSNPVTAVPLYYFNWRVGRLVMTGQWAADPSVAPVIGKELGEPKLTLWQRLQQPDMWEQLWAQFKALGVELWVGSLIVGLIVGGISYWVTRKAISIYRSREDAHG